MLIIGCDYHPSFQYIAWVDTVTGEGSERRLAHRKEAENFYHNLKGRSVRRGMEATGHARWFERWVAELHYELWIGDPAAIRAKRVRKQKNDRQDAAHLLRLLGRIAFHGSGSPVRRIGIYGNCCGIGIGWCRCGRE